MTDTSPFQQPNSAGPKEIGCLIERVILLGVS